MDRSLHLLLLALFSTMLAACGASERCSPGQRRSCTLALEGGVGQGGTQSCGTSGLWGACVSSGVCRTSAGAPLPVYNRCATQEACGPESCATCTSYQGVRNVAAASVCVPFCSVDADCAASNVDSSVAARCQLGLCILLCRAASRCPTGTECLSWIDSATGANFPGFDGLCE